MKKSAMKGFFVVAAVVAGDHFRRVRGKRIKKKLPIRLWGNGSSFQKKEYITKYIFLERRQCVRTDDTV